jgi:hypothetical protein
MESSEKEYGEDGAPLADVFDNRRPNYYDLL